MTSNTTQTNKFKDSYITVFRSLKFPSSQRIVMVVFAFWATVLAQFGMSEGDYQLDTRSTEVLAPTDSSVNNPSTQTPVRDLVQSLDELVDTTKFESRLTRTSALRKLLAQADVEQLQQYWEEAHSFGVPVFKQETQARIIQRWSVLDPTSAFTFVYEQLAAPLQSSLLGIVFTEWSVSDLEDALSHVSQLDLESKENALRCILIAREDLSIAERREIANKLGYDWLAIEVLTEVAESGVLFDPKHEWETFISSHEDRLHLLSSKHYQLLTQIVHAWIVRDGLAVFQTMQASLPSSTLLPEITRSATLELVTDDPQLAFDFALDVYYREQAYQYRVLVRELVYRWALFDPMSAFKATRTVNAHVLRRALQRTTLRQWARKDSRELLRSLETLPENLHSLIRELAIIEMAEKTPEAVSEFLLGIVERQRRESVAHQIASRWAHQDTVAALFWIESDQSVFDIKGELTEAVFREFARNTPWLALQTAIDQPVSEEDKGLEATVINTIARIHSLDIAVAMLPKVRAGTTRIDAYDSVIKQSLSEHDPERALDLFLQLCEHEANSTTKLVETVAEKLPMRLFESIDQVSSRVIRVNVAQELLRQYEHNDKFDQSQLKKLKEISQKQPSDNVR